MANGHPAQSTAEPLAGWPSDVRPISVDGMDRLGVGDDGTLYWDGKPIVVRKAIDLSWWQATIALFAALGSLSSGVVAALPYFGVTP